MNTSTQTSPQLYARIGGLAYLFIIIAGAAGEMLIRNTIIVPGEAAATAHNITASPLLWRIGIAGDLLMHVCDLILALVYYVLLKQVNKNLALLSVLFGLIQTAVLVANKLNLLMPLFFLGEDAYLNAFNPEQLQALAYISIKAHNYGFGIGLIFFDFECLIDGYLVIRSGFLPKILGILLSVVGVCYLVNSFILILFPKMSGSVFEVVMLPILVGEFAMCIWLLFKGVNMKKWNTSQPGPIL